jgi:hypothetical protein
MTCGLSEPLLTAGDRSCPYWTVAARTEREDHRLYPLHDGVAPWALREGLQAEGALSTMGTMGSVLGILRSPGMALRLPTRRGPRKGGMGGSIPASSGRILLSLLAEETAYPAGCFYGRLADRYGDGQVFKDVDSIQLGDDFVEQRQEASPEWGQCGTRTPGISRLASLAIYVVGVSCFKATMRGACDE